MVNLTPGEQIHRTTYQIGKAGEHIVCADLLLSGHLAGIAPEGLRYDVIADVDGKMLRIAVKSTAKSRPRRNGKRYAYVFQIGRRSFQHGRSMWKLYTPDCVDLVALVAIDKKAVAYFPIAGLPQIIWMYDATALDVTRTFGPKTSTMRRFENMTLEEALRGE